VTGFNTKIGASVLVGLAAIYMIGSLATGRNAHAERQPELKADEAGLDVYKTASFLLKEPAQIAIVDVRSKEHFELYHLPKSISLPGADASAVVASIGSKQAILIVGETDKEASALTAEVIKAKPAAHFLKDGVRAWYLAFELPVELFSDKPAPRGYAESVGVVNTCLRTSCANLARAQDAVAVLAKSPYEATMLQGKRSSPTTGPKKKISGGCGG
jgi:rhodanese-related sulfurtransferase